MAANITMQKKYHTRGVKRDYKAMSDTVLPRSLRRKKTQDTLYPVDILEQEAGKVKVHYIGYGSSDEWKDEDEIVDICEPVCLLSNTFSLHQELALAIKSRLQSSRKGSPEVKIVMDFDKTVYESGLKVLGTLKKERGIEKYIIKTYSDLDTILGEKWYIRGLNVNGDFCYAIKETVCFYLTKKAPLVDYKPHGQSFKKSLYCRGYSLVFTFIRGDGVANDYKKMYFCVDH